MVIPVVAVPDATEPFGTDTGYFECNYCGANMDTDEDELEGDEDEVRRNGR